MTERSPTQNKCPPRAETRPHPSSPSTVWVPQAQLMHVPTACTPARRTLLSSFCGPPSLGWEERRRPRFEQTSMYPARKTGQARKQHRQGNGSAHSALASIVETTGPPASAPPAPNRVQQGSEGRPIGIQSQPRQTAAECGVFSGVQGEEAEGGSAARSAGQG